MSMHVERLPGVRLPGDVQAAVDGHPDGAFKLREVVVDSFEQYRASCHACGQPAAEHLWFVWDAAKDRTVRCNLGDIR